MVKRVFADLFKVLEHPELTRWGPNAIGNVFLRNEAAAGGMARRVRALAVRAQPRDVIPSPSVAIHNWLLSPVAGDPSPSSDLPGWPAHAYKENTHP